MKFKAILFLIFPFLLQAQSPRIALLDSDSILVQSDWYALLQKDAQALGQLVQDSILDIEMEKQTLRYNELMEEYLRRSCSYRPGYYMELEKELQDRQDNFKQLAKKADTHILIYENSLLELWKEELKTVLTALAVDWNYDLVLDKQAMVFLSLDNVREGAMFEQAVLKALNQKIDQKAWSIKEQKLQNKCLENIQKEIYIHPVDVQKALSKLDVFRRVALWMHGAKLT